MDKRAALTQQTAGLRWGGCEQDADGHNHTHTPIHTQTQVADCRYACARPFSTCQTGAVFLVNAPLTKIHLDSGHCGSMIMPADSSFNLTKVSNPNMLAHHKKRSSRRAHQEIVVIYPATQNQSPGSCGAFNYFYSSDICEVIKASAAPLRPRIAMNWKHYSFPLVTFGNSDLYSTDKLV